MKNDDEFNALRREVEEALYKMIEDGLVEVMAIDENGDFIYNLTDSGKERAKGLKDGD